MCFKELLNRGLEKKRAIATCRIGGVVRRGSERYRVGKMSSGSGSVINRLNAYSKSVSFQKLVQFLLMFGQ
jgi:hypothetical protein